MTEDEVRGILQGQPVGLQGAQEVVFLDAIPVTSVGKPDRKTLRQMQLSV